MDLLDISPIFYQIGSTDSLLDIRSLPGEEERQTVRFQVLWGEIGAPVSGGISYITLPWEPKTLIFRGYN